MVTVAHLTPHAKRHLDQSNRFATIYPRDQQTHRQTDSQTMNIASNRLHLYAMHMRCGLKLYENKSYKHINCELKQPLKTEHDTLRAKVDRLILCLADSIYV